MYMLLKLYIYIYIYVQGLFQKFKLHQDFKLSHISKLCMGLTCIEIKTKIYISISSFIRSGNVLSQKMFNHGSSFWMGLRIFWTPLV